MYFAIAALGRRFDLELFETTKKIIEFAREFRALCPDEGNYCILESAGERYCQRVNWESPVDAVWQIGIEVSNLSLFISWQNICM